jgi:hypothetical protein
MNEEQANKPPIGRYILIAFIFVLIFIGASYLVYRFTRSNSGGVSTNPTPTPTSTSSSTQAGSAGSSGLHYGTVLPAPSLGPVSPNSRLFIPPTTTSYPIVRTNIAGYRTIAQDGRGNLLFDNLTHDEFYALERARIDADSRLRLAQEDNKGSLDQLREQNASTTRQQLNQQATQLALAKQQLDLELARLQSQLAIAKLQAEKQPTAANQIRLAQIQAQTTQKQAQEQRLSQEIQSKSELASQTLQSATQLAIAKNQSATSLASQAQQLSAAEKQQVAQLAYQKAIQENDHQYALLASQLSGDLTRLEQSDQHRQTLELMQLQASIQEKLLLLQSYNNQDYYSGYYY